MKKVMILFLLAGMTLSTGEVLSQSQNSRMRSRSADVAPGDLPTGEWNAITDVPGVLVGQKTLVRGDSVRTGVTAVLPHGGNIFQEKVPAAISVGNGFGKLTGITQVRELGNLEAPITLTNTLNVGTAVEAVVDYTLDLPRNEDVRSVNAVVGETNDGYLNDIRGMHVTRQDVKDAITAAASGPVEEGVVGAGTGTRCFGYKGGVGTSSRIVKIGDKNQYAVGVLVQTNYGGELSIAGVPVGQELRKEPGVLGEPAENGGSCMVVVATDAPLSARNLERLAKRSFLGLARTGSVMSNGSGDYAIAFSTAYRLAQSESVRAEIPSLVANTGMTTLFSAVVDATEEAVYNSLFMATTTRGYNGRVVKALPIGKTVRVLRENGVLDNH